MDLQDQLEVPLPDHGGWDQATTKADLLKAVVAYLGKVAPAKADAKVIAQIYDQSLIRRGYPLPASDCATLF